MHAHEAMAALPIDLGPHDIAGRGQWRAGGGDVYNVIGALAFARVAYGDAAAIGKRQRAAVAGLTAPLRIEDGAVEADAEGIDGDDARLAAPEIGIVAKEQIGHGSSQLGVGRLRSRRNAGLNSFDM